MAEIPLQADSGAIERAPVLKAVSPAVFGQRLDVLVDLIQAEGMEAALGEDIDIDVVMVGADGFAIEDRHRRKSIRLISGGMSYPVLYSGKVTAAGDEPTVKLFVAFAFQGRHCGYAELEVPVEAGGNQHD